MAQTSLGNASDFLMSGKTLLPIEHTTPHGIVFGDDGMPMPVKPLPTCSGLFVLDDGGAVGIKTKLMAKVGNDALGVVASHGLLWADFVMA